MPKQNERFLELDVFRAFAILLVIGYHYFSRWTPPRYEFNLYPYGQYFSEFFLFKYGHLGVDLFFIISGFVIAMTLETCRSPFEFVVRRAARLLPAMIVCSILTALVVTSLVYVEHFRSMAKPINLLPSWTFTQPEWWRRLLGFDKINYIDGSYWSLAVEVKFYAWACLCFFALRSRFVLVFFICSTCMWLLFVIGTVSKAPWLSMINAVAFGDYAALFAAGIIFHRIYSVPSTRREYWPLLVLCFVQQATIILLLQSEWRPASGQLAALLSFFMMFLALAAGWRLPETSIVRLLSRVGLASYSLYLLHQNIGVGLLNRGMGLESGAQVLILLLAIVMGLVWLSYVVYDLVERPGKRFILRLALRRQNVSASSSRK